DQAVLNHLEGNLVLNLFDLEARCGLVFDDEGLDLVVSDIACPDDRNVAPGRVTDPLLLTVDDPGVAVAFRGCLQATGRSGTYQRLGKAEAADLFPARHWRQPLLFLLFRSAQVNGTHRQAIVHTEECRD